MMLIYIIQDIWVVALPVDAELIRSRVDDARRCISEIRRLTGVPFTDLSMDQVYSLRYNIIVLVESLASIAIHILVEEYSYRPEGYSDAFEKMAYRLGLQPYCIDKLKAMARLRNLRVHRYWVVDDGRVYNDAKRDLTCVEELLDRVSGRYGRD